MTNELISLRESIDIIEQYAGQLKPTTELIPVRWANHRVLSGPVYARRSNPSTALAAMDGIAIDYRAAPHPASRLKPSQWTSINTGETLPAEYNAVVPIEQVDWDDETPVLKTAVSYLQHVRHAGEDFPAGAMLFTPGHQLQAPDISLLLASGYQKIEVFCRPLVAFIPTGSELVMEPAEDAPGKNIESNSAIVSGFVESCGGAFKIEDPVPDEPDDIAQTLKLWSSRADILVISAGTSRGTRDRSAKVVELLGKIFFHGVNIGPGKPVFFGKFADIPLLGLPGYPAASYIGCYLYLRRLVCSLSRIERAERYETFVSAEEIASRPNDYFYRVQCFDVEGQKFVRRISKGAGSTISLSEMDGLLHVPPNTEIKKRDGVRIDLLRDRAENTIAVRGVYDALIGRLFDLFRESTPSQRLIFWQAPAQDALQNIAERNVHLATINIPEGGHDPFPEFSRQLQERMLRYRMFSRSVALVFKSGSDYGDLTDIAAPINVAVPHANQKLWDVWIKSRKADITRLLPVPVVDEEAALSSSLKAGHWEAAFIDSRYVDEDQTPIEAIKEHLDLVIPESLRERPAFASLIETLESEHFAQRVVMQPGCDISTRGLLHPA